MIRKKSTGKNAREKSVEDYLRDEVMKHGGICVKLDPNLYPGITDRLVILDGAVFVECKRPRGGRLAQKQIAFRQKCVDNGAEWRLISTKAEVDDFIADSRPYAHRS